MVPERRLLRLSGAELGSAGAARRRRDAGGVRRDLVRVTVNAAGFRAFKAHYLGDGTYNGSDGACEPLQVVDANIQITPQTDTNAVGTNHVLTITVNALNGTLDAGTHTATAAIKSGPGSFVGPATCDYTGGLATASCTVTITSAVAGTTVVSASSNVPVSGVSIARTTDPDGSLAGPGGTDNAEKVWVDANISITPQTDTNAVNTNHVLTITVATGSGTIDAGNYTSTAEIVSGPAASSARPPVT